jgi:primary-amine oxidase
MRTSSSGTPSACITTGFRLMPSGFFDRDPGIDLAPPVNGASCDAKA